MTERTNAQAQVQNIDHSRLKAQPQGRGRPPDPEKRERIILAATEMFAKYGFGVSVNKIANTAGVSKQTIYNLFGTKQDLFGAAVSKYSLEILGNIPEKPAPEALEKVLSNLAMKFLVFMTSDKIPQVYRIMLQAPDDIAPDFIGRFYDTGPKRGIKRMAVFLKALHDEGTLVVPDPVLAAESFFGALKGNLIIQNMLCIRQGWTHDELQCRVDYCVQMFLNQHRPKGN